MSSLILPLLMLFTDFNLSSFNLAGDHWPPFSLLPLPLLPVPALLLLNLPPDDLKNTFLRYNSCRHTMTTYQLSLPSPMLPPSPLPLLLVPLHQSQPPIIASFDMCLPSLPGLTLVAVVGWPTTIFLDAPTEVRVFRVNRGVVLWFSMSFLLFFQNGLFDSIFLSLWHIILPMLFCCCGTFTFDLISYCLRVSHLTSHWTDSFHDSLDKSTVTIMSHQ